MKKNYEDLPKLLSQVDAFAAEMKKRLTEKHKFGYNGHDRPDLYADEVIINDIIIKIAKLHGSRIKKHAADLANYALFMFLRCKE